MMMPRLYLARNLMRDDGVIFVSIDDNEVHNLRLLMNEVFGEENFEGLIHWRRRPNQPNDKTKMIGLVAEHILAYAKNSEALKKIGVGKIDITGNFSNPDHDSRGEWASKPWKVGSDQSGSRYIITAPNGNKLDEEWMGDKSSYENLLTDNRIFFPRKGDGMPRKKYFKSERQSEGQCASNWWDHFQFGHNQGANDCMTNLFNIKNVFSNPKPIELIRGLLQISNTTDYDLVLDFFAGSCTTAHAVMQLNKEDGGHRRFICVQMPELCDEKSEAFKAGYKTIADISKERIRRAGKKIQAEIDAEDEKKKGELPLDGAESVPAIDLGFKVFKLRDSNFKQWRQVKGNDVDAVQLQMQDFIDPVAPDASIDNMAYELLLKSGKDLDSKVEHAGGIYRINDTELILMLEIATQEIVDAVLALHPKKVIALDRLFADNDQLKTNTSLQMRDSGIEFKTI